MKSLFSFFTAPAATPATGQDDRLAASMHARDRLGDDFFGGWDAEDVDLFRRYAVASEPTPGMITDFLGVKTAVDLVPWAAHMGGSCIGAVPVPDDCVRAEAIEYFALLHSMEHTAGSSFTMAELGASFGPWICTGGAVARRLGKKEVRLVAVEASSFMYRLIERHLKDNDISAAGNGGCRFDLRLIRGAVATENRTLYFPVVKSAAENGGQAADQAADTDYVGRHVEYEEVPAVTLHDVLPDGAIDLLHVDIQGFESDVIRQDVALLNERVRHLFIGTHSRKIEGELLECLCANGWTLLRERPTKFTFRSDIDSVVGMTTRDGGQYWVNSRPR